MPLNTIKQIFSIIAIIIWGCKSPDTEGVKHISVTELDELLSDKNIQLVDVRTVREVNAGFIDGAENIVFDSNFSNKLENLNKSIPVVLYCKRGGRSAKAASIIKKQGFLEIYDLRGGYDAYVKKTQN